MTHFMQEERRKSIVEEHGVARYERMIRDLSNPMKIKKTFDTIIPAFLNHSIEQLNVMHAV
jgi:hypothetical protein